jgi:tRNA dimethylallyltransferase
VIDLPREMLYDRINKRVDIMLENGLLQEVQELLEFQNLSALNTVGYAELFDYFNNKIPLKEAIELIKRNSRRYAKRQLTWFRRDEKAIWIQDLTTENQLQYIISHLE